VPVRKPVITDLNPASVFYRSQNRPFTVIITGAGFDTVAPVNGILVDGSPIAYTIRSSTEIFATFPAIIADVPGNHPVVIIGELGSSDPYSFMVTEKGYTISASSDEIGWIKPSGTFRVPAGSSQTFILNRQLLPR
jgi:hypothetical protein